MNKKKNIVLGYSPYNSPSNGMGPFKEIFDCSQRIVSYSDLSLVDAVVIWGGSDISPAFYNETPISNSGPKEPSSRDIYEWEIIKTAHRLKLPMIGVCRGAQMMCAYAGGKLIQDVTGHSSGRHSITTFDEKELSVTSIHHQMMWPYDIEHELLAWTTEHLSSSYLPPNDFSIVLKKKKRKEPEVVYFPSINAFAIQSHPEWESPNSPITSWTIETFIKRCYQ